MKQMKLGFAAFGLVLLSAGIAAACHVEGTVVCSPLGTPLAGVTIDVVATSGTTFSGSVTTDANGYYYLQLPGVLACYTATVVLGPQQGYVTPPNGVMSFCITSLEGGVTLDPFAITDPSCAPTGTCWLTGGGAKFSAIVGLQVGESGRKHNWGGNVYPGCSSTAGDGGSWNHIDADLKLHFHGQHIEVVECGNVEGIPPGSTSPRTPFNYIEFKGTGSLKGIQGNKDDYGTVFFYARAEDRNEPGSTGQRDGAGKDRYFLNVYTDELDPSGSSVILVDMDGDPATVDPLIITDGNMQIHDTSCDTPAIIAAPMTKTTSPAPAEGKTWGELKSTYK